MALAEANGYELTDQAGLVQARIRDRQLDIVGRPTTVTMPTSGTPTFDEYGDPLEPAETTTTTIRVIPLLDKYFMMLDLFGLDNEDNLPLELHIKSTDLIPEGSLVTLDWIKGESRMPKVWEVISSEVKIIEHVYAKVLKVVPKRGLRVEENVNE